ncbi:MAG: hypothetical protein WBD34_08045 [Burkholderiaceae bacterium]
MKASIVRAKAALGIYLVIGMADGMADVILGARYFSANQFMPYHAQAISASWPEVDSGIQTLILALMKVAGGGWLALGFLTIVLAVAAFKTGSAGIRWALPTGTLIFYAASFVATWGVYQETGAPTPWGQSLAMIGLALLALVIDAPWSSRVRDPCMGDNTDRPASIRPKI